MIEEPLQEPDTPRDELAYRLRQQSILSDFGKFALECRDLDHLHQRATEMVAEGLQASLCKLLRWRPDTADLLVCAGVGWSPGVIGNATLGADMESPAGYALHTGKAVISNHLQRETRFRTPALLVQHGVKRAINVIVRGGEGDEPFGVLEADSTSPGKFEEADIVFMCGFANLLGVAIDRKTEHAKAEQHQEDLRREASHRLKNSLAMVASLLAVQARSSPDPEVRIALNDAQTRVEAIAEAHDQLWRQTDMANLDLAELVSSLSANLEGMSPQHRLILVSEPIIISPDKAIPAGLILNELITNAFKYAYPGAGGEVHVSLRASGANVRLEVSDRGVGFPDSFDPAQVRSFGMKVVAGLARELGGNIQFESNAAGARIVVEFPTEARGSRL